MTTSEREERRLGWYSAASAAAKARYGKEFHQLTSQEAVAVVDLITERRPELRASFDEPVGLDKVEPPSPSGTVDFSLRPATLTTAQRFGFSQADLDADPLKRSLVGHVARAEQLKGTVDEFDTAIRAVGKQHGLNPEVYSERLKIGTIMARSHHPLADRS